MGDELVASLCQTIDFLLKGDLGDVAYPILPFCVVCTLIGVLAVIVDYILDQHLGVRSLLKLAHGPGKLWVFIPVWGIGSGVVALLGVPSDVIKMSVPAAVVVGLSWPSLMTRIVASSRAEAAPEEPAEAAEEEEEEDEA